jgi:hypothetical protein
VLRIRRVLSQSVVMNCRHSALLVGSCALEPKVWSLLQVVNFRLRDIRHIHTNWTKAAAFQAGRLMVMFNGGWP